ncbi:MAG: aminotransferase class V-fold PLP-dependent enzyme [Pseudomonadales bacterium]|nr:aminotransferase class V-fold PLP-dependent enzyme [Pseudomonadales bacterium]
MPTHLPGRRHFLQALGLTAIGAPLATSLAAVTHNLEQVLHTVPDGDALALQRHYFLPEDFTYLNHASIGTTPRAVHEAHVGYLALCETSPSLYIWGEPWRLLAQEVRQQAAQLMGVDADNVAITHNTTEGFNILAHGLPLGPGDEVLFSSLNHPGATVAWQRLAEQRGFSVRQFDFPIDETARMTRSDIVALHESQISAQTRALVIPHIDNIIGLRHPLNEIATMAKARGVQWVLVDGAQAVGMIPVNLQGSGVDAYATSPHKWVQSPKGLGLFWVTSDLQSILSPMWHRTPDKGLAGSARQYEDYSTRAWPAVVALGDALAFQAALGEQQKQARYQAIWSRIKQRVDAEQKLSWLSPSDWANGSMIVGVRVEGRSARDIAAILDSQHKVDLRAFGGSQMNHLRLAPNMATTDAQLDRVLDLLLGFAAQA